MPRPTQRLPSDRRPPPSRRNPSATIPRKPSSSNNTARPTASKKMERAAEKYTPATQRAEIVYVRVVQADGSVIKAGEDAVQDLTAPVEREAPVYTDYRQKHITVPGLRPGDVLEYDMVTVVHTPLAAGQFWADYDFDKNNIMLDEQLDVDVPADRPLKLKNKPSMDPKISDANGRRLYHWTSSHLEREDDTKDKDKEKDKSKE